MVEVRWHMPPNTHKAPTKRGSGRNKPAAALSALDGRKMRSKSNQTNPPTSCPECGHHSFIKLEAEKGGGLTLLTILAFIVDMFTPGMTKSTTLEAMNPKRPGWMCENCGWEIRVKQKQ